MANNFALGALDLCKLYGDESHQEVIWESIELAPRLEAMGYTRYWLAEHHGSDVAHGSPELLVPVLGGVTRTMRIGTAGILLRLYSPYKIAENFRLLHTLFPDRIDLGIARGFVSTDREKAFLSGPEIPFEKKVSQLLGYVRGTQYPVANPANTAAPEIWMLGSKMTSMELAAEWGTAFCYALFLDVAASSSTAEVINQYRKQFKPSVNLKQPKWSIAIAGVCAGSVEQAHTLAPTEEIGVLKNILGTPSMWRDQLVQLRDQTETSEFIIMDLCRGVDKRARSYELLASAIL